MKSTLFGLFSIFLLIQDSYPIEFDIKLGDKIEMCCKLDYDQNDGLSIFAADYRLQMLINNKVVPQDFVSFQAKYPDFSVSRKDNTLCLVKSKATLKDDKFLMKCIVIKEGIGSTINSETNTLRVYEELKFNEKLDKVLNVKVGESVNVECSASGSPDLKISWRTENKEILFSGTSSTSLKIKNITPDMNGIEYTCEASTSIPKDQPASLINQSIKLNVLFKPEMDIKTTIVHTDLGLEELFNISVKGNPQPKLECPLLNIKAERVVSISNSIPFSYVYIMKIDQVTEKHIGTYNCTAYSDEGSVTKRVTLSLKPENIQITSLNETKYSDFYLLSWTMNSKSLISNITITTEITRNNNSTVTNKTISKAEVDSYQKSAGNSENNWKKVFSYPLKNITGDRQYKISLQICNRHECILLKNCVFFSTPLFNGENKYDELTAPLDSGDPRRESWNLKPSMLFVITQSTTMLFIPLVLQHIY